MKYLILCLVLVSCASRYAVEANDRQSIKELFNLSNDQVSKCYRKYEAPDRFSLDVDIYVNHKGQVSKTRYDKVSLNRKFYNCLNDIFHSFRFAPHSKVRDMKIRQSYNFSSKRL